MNTRRRRLLAYLIYLKRPMITFLPLFGLMLMVLVVGSLCFRLLYEQQDLSYTEALYITFSLLFMEHLIDFPNHWLLRIFYFALPPLGLVVVLDGIVRFSYHVLRRDESGKEWARAMCKTLNNHVVLCGLGRLGFRTLQKLLDMGEQVCALEKDPDCPNIAFARRNGVAVRIGHRREEGILDDLNIAGAKSIILATDDDLANLELALDARKVNPDIRVVLRMFDQELAAKVRESMDIELAFSTSELSAPLFASSSSDRSIVNSFFVNGELLMVSELVVSEDSELIGKSIRELGGGQHIFVLSHQRGEEPTLFPSAETVMAAGDGLTVQTNREGLNELHRMNNDPKPY